VRRATSAGIAIQHQRIAAFNDANPAAQSTVCRATSAESAIQHQRIAAFNVANPAAQLGPIQAQYVATDQARRPVNQTAMPLTLENIPQNNTTRQLRHLDNQIANLDANGANINEEYEELSMGLK
jgi:hypothetical protein